jgi:hypothetical protein
MEQVALFVYYNYNLPMLCIGDMNKILCDMDKNSSKMWIDHAWMVSDLWVNNVDSLILDLMDRLTRGLTNASLQTHFRKAR